MTAPRERPILFSGSMISAILAGRKSMTRRVVKGGGFISDTDAFVFQGPAPFTVGDVLWCRESAYYWSGGAGGWSDVVYVDSPDVPGILRDAAALDKLRNDDPPRLAGVGSWRMKPSIFMPRWASRLSLRVTGVKIERVQDISDADARAEGVNGGCRSCGNPEPCGCAAPLPDPRDCFAGLWMEINGRASWDANPWVWCVSFERVEAAVRAQVER